MNRITIETAPHKDQLYPTAGDYWWAADGELFIRVSELQNRDHMFLIGLHEMVEAYLAERRGIPEPEIRRFDIEHPELEEPGMDPRAPYHKEHFIATIIEMMVAKELGVDWREYDDAVKALFA